MFGKYLNTVNYEEERQKSRARKLDWNKTEVVGFYTEMFLRPDHPAMLNKISPQRMKPKAFASVQIDVRLQAWEQKIFD